MKTAMGLFLVVFLSCAFSATSTQQSSNSTYNFIKENGKWKAAFTIGGGYPVGHVITQLYTLQNFGREFYSDGTMGSPNFMERRPDANN